MTFASFGGGRRRRTTGSTPAPVTQTLTTIVLTGPTTVIATHATTAYGAIGYDQFDQVMSGVTFTFQSSDPLVAGIGTSSGIATGLGAGTSSITAVSGSVTSNAITLTVAAQVATSPIVVTPQTFSVGTTETQQLTATVNDQGTPPNPISGASVSWGSGTPGVATVSAGGLVTGVSVGSATITATSGAATGTAAASVIAPAPVVTSVTVAPSTFTVSIASTSQLTATVLDQHGTPMPSELVTWATSDAAKATVDSTGLVTGVSAGSVTITARSVTDNTKSGTSSGTVSAVNYPVPSTTDYVHFDSDPVFAAAAAISNDTAATTAARAFFTGYNGAPPFAKNYDGAGTPAMRTDYTSWVSSSVNQVGGIVASGSPQTVTLANVSGLNTSSQYPTFEPGTPVSPNSNRERVLITAIDSANSRVTGTFGRNHANGSPVGVDQDGITTGSDYSKNLLYPEIDATLQYFMHFGRTATGGGVGTIPSSIGDRTVFEVMNNLAQATPPQGTNGSTGTKILLTHRPDVLLPTTLTQNVTASGSPQTVTVASTAGLTTGTSGTNFGTGSQFISGLAGESGQLNLTGVGSGTITAIFASNHTNGTALNLRRNDGRWYIVYRSPQPGQMLLTCDSSPFYGNGFSTSVNLGALGLNPDDFIGTGHRITMRMKAESAIGAGDAIWQVWMNNTLVFDNVRDGFSTIKLGPSGWSDLQGPATFRSPAFDQTQYFAHYKAWSPNSALSAPTASSYKVNTTALYNQVVIPNAPSGVPTTIRPYVWNGSSYVANNGGGTSDPSFGDIALANYTRGTTQTITHSGLTTGQAYNVKYSLLNALGESALSNAVTATPAFAAFDAGVDFRQSLAYVTDPAYAVFAAATGNNYPTVRTNANGVALTIGWDGTTALDNRDRSTSVDPRLAGMCFNTNVGTPRTFRLNLPVPGTYNVYLACGDATFGSTNMRCEVIDGASATSLFVVSASSLSGGQFVDATNVVRSTAANWVSNNQPTLVTVTSVDPYLYVKLGQLTNTGGQSDLAHVRVTRVT